MAARPGGRCGDRGGDGARPVRDRAVPAGLQLQPGGSEPARDGAASGDRRRRGRRGVGGGRAAVVDRAGRRPAVTSLPPGERPGRSRRGGADGAEPTEDGSRRGGADGAEPVEVDPRGSGDDDRGMDGGELREYALGKPGAWADQPWEGDHVAKVGAKIFAFLGDATLGVKCGATRDEADEWLTRYPDDASVMAYIGRSGWNTLRLDGAIPRRRADRGRRHLLRPRRRETAQEGSAPGLVRAPFLTAGSSRFTRVPAASERVGEPQHRPERESRPARREGDR